MSVFADVLRKQIDYTDWASLRMLSAAGALTPAELTHDFQTADGGVVGTLAYIFAGDRVWLARFAGEPPPPFLTDADRDLAGLQQRWPELLGRWKKWAADLTDKQALAEFAYIDNKGRHWKQPLWQLVLHVVNHGTHHRGQVAGF